MKVEVRSSNFEIRYFGICGYSSEFELRNPGFSGFVDMGELVFIRKGMIRGV
uniref:Uncharacterized protein n=1 Tax=Meloidogyne incognita TaxID=6306 RepID=A0A914M7Q8_MELIC